MSKQKSCSRIVLISSVGFLSSVAFAGAGGAGAGKVTASATKSTNGNKLSEIVRQTEEKTVRMGSYNVSDMDRNGTIDSADLGLVLLKLNGGTTDEQTGGNDDANAVASVSGVQGLFAKNYIVTEGGVDYSVMDVYLKFNSASGTGSNGERVVNYFGQATTDASTYGVNKTAKYEVSNGLAFQHSNTSWLPASGAAGGTGNNSWDSFLTVGARAQGAGATGSVTPDVYFVNPNSNVGVITGGSSGTGFVGAGVYQAAPTDAGFQTNASAYADKMVMFGRFTLKCSDIIAAATPSKLTMWCDFVGKSTAQTGGTTLYTLASANLKSDAQTKYTTSSKVWTFDSGFEGANVGQAAWTFGVPSPGAAALVGLAALLTGRRRN